MELKSVLDLICSADTCELVFGISDHLSGNVFSLEFTFVCVCICTCGKMGGLESVYLA